MSLPLRTQLAVWVQGRLWAHPVNGATSTIVRIMFVAHTGLTLPLLCS